MTPRLWQDSVILLIVLCFVLSALGLHTQANKPNTVWLIDIKGQEKIIKKANNGEVDVIIGTHKIFSKDIQFKNLGLIIIDEEQRFGVQHKEKIKQFIISLRKELVSSLN